MTEVGQLLGMIKALFLILPLQLCAQFQTGIMGNEMHFNQKTVKSHWMQDGNMWGNPNTGELGGEYSYLISPEQYYPKPYTVTFTFDYYANNEAGVSWGFDVEYIDLIVNDTVKPYHDTTCIPFYRQYGGNKINESDNDTAWHKFIIKYHANAYDVVKLRWSYDCDNYGINSYRKGSRPGFWIRNFKSSIKLDEGWGVYPDTGLIDLSIKEDSVKTTKSVKPEMYLYSYDGKVYSSEPYVIYDLMGREGFKQEGIYIIKTEYRTLKAYLKQ